MRKSSITKCPKLTHVIKHNTNLSQTNKILTFHSLQSPPLMKYYHTIFDEKDSL